MLYNERAALCVILLVFLSPSGFVFCFFPLKGTEGIRNFCSNVANDTHTHTRTHAQLHEKTPTAVQCHGNGEGEREI